jgi:hypothetical protein
MRIRRILMRGAVAFALVSAGVGVAAGAAQASPVQDCAHFINEATYYQNLGQSYTQIGVAWSAAGYYAAANDAFESASLAFGWQAAYDDMWHRSRPQALEAGDDEDLVTGQQVPRAARRVDQRGQLSRARSSRLRILPAAEIGIWSTKCTSRSRL